MCTNPGCCGGEDKFTVFAFDLSAFPRGLAFLLLDNMGMIWSLFLDHGGCRFLILILKSSTMLLHRDIWNLEAGNFKLDQTRTKHWHARRQATIQIQSSLAAQPHHTALAAQPASIDGSLTPSGNGLAVTIIVQHKLSAHAMSMLANVSRMYAECFDKVFYHVNSRILKCKMTKVITMGRTCPKLWASLYIMHP